MFTLSHVVDEAGQAFDRHLPAAGDQLALHAQRHEAEDEHQRGQHPGRAVGEADVIRPDVQRNDRFHRELVHRVDFAFGRHVARYLFTQLPGGVRFFVNRMMFLTPTPNPKNSISRKNSGKVR